nr:hypothetical protein [Tanacetum cinerariifolium]
TSSKEKADSRKKASSDESLRNRGLRRDFLEPSCKVIKGSRFNVIRLGPGAFDSAQSHTAALTSSKEKADSRKKASSDESLRNRGLRRDGLLGSLSLNLAAK